MPKKPPMSPSRRKALTLAHAPALRDALEEIHRITSTVTSCSPSSSFLSHVAQCHAIATRALKLLEGEPS